MKITDDVFSAIHQHPPTSKVFQSKDFDWQALIEDKRKMHGRAMALGVPNRKNEDWKYTRLDKFAKTNFALPTTTDTEFDLQTLPQNRGDRVVFENGILREDLSQMNQTGISYRAFNQSQDFKEGPNLTFTSGLAYSRSQNDMVIEIRSKEKVFLQIVHLASGTSQSSTHLAGIVKSQSSVVVEEYVMTPNEGETYQNLLSQWQVESNAQLRLAQSFDLSEKAYVTQTLKVSLDRDAQAEAFTMANGGQINRHDIESSLNGEGADAQLNGLYFANSGNVSDFSTILNHKAAHCSSRQLCKGLLAGSGQGVFNGLVHVHRNAQKTDAAQLNKNLVLSKEAEVNTRPRLLVDADDVKAAHGATVGQLEDEEVFYLQSRAISRDKAISMLTEGYAKEVVYTVSDDQTRQWFLEKAELAARNLTADLVTE